MRRYITHVQHNLTPHERRQHAMQIAGVITALLFVGWLMTLGLRLSTPGPVVEKSDTSNTAATLNAVGETLLLGY